MNFGDKWVMFEITDGTPANTIDLISADKAFSITEWFPAMSEAKGGGIYVSSLFDEGSRLLHRTLGNSYEEIRVIANDVSEDALAESLIKFRQLLQAATSYWTSDWGATPIYFRIRGYRETNIRYAVLVNWSAPADTLAYFKHPDKVYGSVSKLSLSMLFERGQFQDTPIGFDLAKKTFSVQRQYNTDFFYGTYYDDQTQPTEDLIVVGNKTIESNVQNVYTHDDSAGVWSANLVRINHVSILPDPMGVDDALYIGVMMHGSAARFSNVVIDLDPLELLTDTTITWEYSTSTGGWATVYAKDNTDDFSVAGMNSVVWKPPSDWATMNLLTEFGGSAPDVNKYWIRARVTAVGTSGNVPKVNNYPIYVANWNNFSVYGSQFNCDIAPKIRLDTEIQSKDLFAANSLEEILIGTRSIDRGEKFVSNLQLSDKGNFSYITVTATSANNANFVNDYRAPTGRSILVDSLENIAGTGLANIAKALITDYSEDFAGKYRLFVRYRLEDTALDKKVELFVYQGEFSHEVYSLTQVMEYGGAGSIADFGIIEFAGKKLPSDTVTDINFSFGYTVLESGLSAYSFTLFDIVLIPVDEWSGRYQNPKAPEYSYVFRIDGTRSPKYPTIASLLTTLDKQKFSAYLAKDQVTSPKLQINADQKVYFMLFDRIAATNTPLSADFEATLGIKLYGVNRFFSQRGSR